MTQLSLELTTDPEVIKFIYIQNSQSFKYANLDSSNYVTIEYELNQGYLKPINSLGVYHFVLRDFSIQTSQDDKTGNIVSSVSTFNRKGWTIEPKGELKEVITPCVGYVFTIPQHRKKGYAIEMIKKLNEYWDNELTDSFMFLYSAVGEFYSKAGYKSYNTPPQSIDVTGNIPDINDTSSEIEYLFKSSKSDYEEIIELENEIIKNNLIKHSKVSEKTLVSLSADFRSVMNYIQRDYFISSRLKSDVDHKNDKYGVILKDSNEWVLWIHDWAHKEFAILSMHYKSLNSFKKLINLSLKDAKTFGFNNLSIWDESLRVNEALYDESFGYLSSLGVKTTAINGALPAMRLCNGSKEAEWLNNEKWCWY